MRNDASDSKDSYNLARFVSAQDAVYESVLQELKSGRKRSHWMWFIFPQIKGLGSSSTAKYYAISGVEEAQAYMRHPVLSNRISQCTELVREIKGKTASAIFPYPDDLKFHSSMTLFEFVADKDHNIFHLALNQFFEGQGDPATLKLLGA